MKTEGRNAVLELLKTGKNIDKLLIEKGAQGSASMIFAEARKRNIRVQFVDKQVLDKESESRRHQGVIAFTTDYEYYDLDEIIEAKKRENAGFIILCDGIEDVHNLGSILRVAECAGADGVVITKSGCASVTESVIRISAGAAEHIKVAKVPNLNQAVETLQKNGYWVYALEAGGEDIYEEKFDGVLCDVPCSGYGTVSENPDIKLFRKQEDFSALKKAQTKILEQTMKKRFLYSFILSHFTS